MDFTYSQPGGALPSIFSQHDERIDVIISSNPIYSEWGNGVFDTNATAT